MSAPLEQAVRSSHGAGTLFEAVRMWEAPVHALAEPFDTHGDALAVMGFAVLRHHALVDALGLDVPVLEAALHSIGSGYHERNPFHNAIHACDVAVSMSYMIANTPLAAILSPYEKFAAIMASLAHDFDHPGVNNNFLIATDNPLAARYNDQAVLENHHVSSALSILRMRAETDILGALGDAGKARQVRNMMIQLILATDLAANYSIVGDFKRRFAPPPERERTPEVSVAGTHTASHRRGTSSVKRISERRATLKSQKSVRVLASIRRSASNDFSPVPDELDSDSRRRRRTMPPPASVGRRHGDVAEGENEDEDNDDDEHEITPLEESPRVADATLTVRDEQPDRPGVTQTDIKDSGDRLLVLKMAIKCADLGHPAKAWQAHFHWSHLLANEFYAQGDREQELGLPISPFMNRSKHDQLPKQQCGFFDFLVGPMWTAFADAFVYNELALCRHNIQFNRKEWDRLAKEAANVT